MWRKYCGDLCLVLIVLTWSLPNGYALEAIVDPDSKDLKDQVLAVGGLFESVKNQLVFHAAVDVVNSDSSINLLQDLEPITEIVTDDDSYEAIRDACRLLGVGVAAVFGPMSSVSSEHVSSLCDTLNVTHLETHWDAYMEDNDDSFNLYPSSSALAEAHTALMRYWGWKNVAIVYEEDDEIVRMKDLLQEMREDDIEVSFFHRNETESYRDILNAIREEDIENIFVAIEQDDIEAFLRQAMQISMLSNEYSYLFMSLDFHAVDLDDFIYSKANITALRIVDVGDEVLERFEMKIQELEAANRPKPSGASQGPDENDEEEDFEGDDDDNVKFPPKVPTDHALLYDAVKLLALSWKELTGGEAIPAQAVQCKNPDTSQTHDNNAGRIKSIMKKIKFDGLTGTVDFDDKGFRTGVEFAITELGADGLETIGTWSSRTGLNVTADEDDAGKKREKLRVVAVTSAPFLMIEEEDGVKKFTGFFVDFLEELESRLNIEYEIHIAENGTYGVMDQEGKWNGMIGELMDGKADLAVGDITVTEARERAVDFTLPYMTTGLAVLTKDSESSKPGGLWSFFLPLTREVWVYLILAMASTTFVMYISARLSFKEWGLVENHKGEDTMENRFNLYNSFLFVLTTLVHQRMNLDPSAMATRALAAFWYFFTFIILAIVVSNLCETILWEDDGVDYNTVQDVLKARGFSYIAVRSGSTRKFLQESKVPLHQKLSALVERNAQNLPTSVAEGLDRVREGHVAFVMEQASALYATHQDCNFTRTDPFVYHSAYAVATPRGSPYRTLISSEILKMQDTGKLHWMQHRWWNPKRHCGHRDGDDDGDDDDDGEDDNSWEGKVEIRPLNGDDMAGAFAFLYIGLIVASLLAVGELFYVFSTRAKRETHLNSIAVSDHIKQAGFVWKRSMDLSDMRM
ncbi:glutamate receptor ionotropic, kainate 2-like [Ornithodoros turicata]|uniref:glutamate receptor ionotropic, kainate 2-like n=1 Tax=Ornithodoros turicata TaxID=34597 RepID=UPI00313A3764